MLDRIPGASGGRAPSVDIGIGLGAPLEAFVHPCVLLGTRENVVLDLLHQSLGILNRIVCWKVFKRWNDLGNVTGIVFSASVEEA